MSEVRGEARPRRTQGAVRAGRPGAALLLRILAGLAILGLLAWAARSCADRRSIVPGGAFSLVVVLEDGARARVDVGEGRMRIVVRQGPGIVGLDAAAGAREGTVFDLALAPADLERFVDALGGILINVPEAIEYPGDGGMPIRIEAGMRRLDADRVRRYLGRPGASATASLRAVVMGVGARVGELDAQGVDLARVLGVVLTGDALGEDGRNPERLAGLLLAARGLGPADVAIDAGGISSWGAAPDTPASQAPAAAPANMTRPLRLRILNGTGRPGLAARAAARFPSGRFEIIETANADRFGYARTEVRVADEAVLREVVAVLGFGRGQQAVPRQGADVEIVLGADARGL